MFFTNDQVYGCVSKEFYRPEFEKRFPTEERPYEYAIWNKCFADLYQDSWLGL